MHDTLGIHIIADLYEIEADKLMYVENVKYYLNNAVKNANLTKISESFHQFQPYGVTGIILLAESHISIHTWPELNVASIDIYTCGDTSRAYVAFNSLVNDLIPLRIYKKIILRGEMSHDSSCISKLHDY